MYRLFGIVLLLSVPACAIAAGSHGSHGSHGGSPTPAPRSVLVQPKVERKTEPKKVSVPCEREEPTFCQKVNRARLAFTAFRAIRQRNEADRAERAGLRSLARAEQLREESNCKLERVLESIAND